jgi:putative endonuclease
MSTSGALGLEGEALACQQLRQEGCRILHTRWKFHHLELDIVATDGHSLIVAEVKTRRSEQWGDPLDAIDYRKIRNIVYATDAYLKRYQIALPYRFDVIGVVFDGQHPPVIQHIKDAFYPPLG